MSNEYTCSLTGPAGVKAEFSFTLTEAISAMKKWEKLKGDTVITDAQELAIWLLDDTNSIAMISIMNNLRKESD